MGGAGGSDGLDATGGTGNAGGAAGVGGAGGAVADMTGRGGAGAVAGAGGADAMGGMGGVGAMAGTGGAAGSGGMAVTEPDVSIEPDVNGVLPSAGCGMPAFAGEGNWEDQPALDIDGRQRGWAVRFPPGYDPERAYPINLLFHGCGSKTNNVPMESVAGNDAIHVRGASVENCWNDLATGQVDNDTVSYDLPFIQAMIDQMKASACVDENRVWGVGYSSGAWLLTHVACKLPAAFRAVGTVAGEDWAFVRNLDTPECGEGNVAQMYIQDLGDPNNQWDDHKSAMARLVEANGCTPDSAMPAEPSPCERFQDCGDHPVQYCLSTGRGHDRRDDFAPQAFWDFFNELAPRE
jgi:poly(3-hydroxybutyrate) depolymerase